ncbi:hypothetical protein BA898_05455 [Spiribacter roseus]|nr:hypothetical protein BA898_05455 [Spiribacter roseus]
MGSSLRMRWMTRARSITQRVTQVNEWLAGRTPRERVLVCVGAFIVIALIWQMAIFSGQTARLADTAAQQRAVRSEITQLNTTADTVRQQIADLESPDAAVRAEIEALQSDIASLPGGGAGDALDFLAAMPVTEALRQFESTLEDEPALTVIRFDRQMGAGPGTGNDIDEPPMDVDHRQLRLVFEATFAQTVSLLSRLEALSVPLVWRVLDYAVIDHPTARVTVRFDLYALGGSDQ